MKIEDRTNRSARICEPALPADWPDHIDRETGGTAAAAVAQAIERDRYTVDAEIFCNLHDIAKLGEMLRSHGVDLVCNHCGDVEEPVAAIVRPFSQAMEPIILCGVCYRELREMALGEVS